MQLNIEGIAPPPRPTVTDEMILAAAKVVGEKIDGDAATIARHYTHPMDGYELAKELDRWGGWDTSRDDMEALDEVEHLVKQELASAEKEWFANNDIKPPLPIGSATTRGVIAGIYEHGIARYRVKENGCAEDGRYLIIKFEDARPADAEQAGA